MYLVLNVASVKENKPKLLRSLSEPHIIGFRILYLVIVESVEYVSEYPPTKADKCQGDPMDLNTLRLPDLGTTSIFGFLFRHSSPPRELSFLSH